MDLEITTVFSIDPPGSGHLPNCVVATKTSLDIGDVRVWFYHLHRHHTHRLPAHNTCGHMVIENQRL